MRVNKFEYMWLDQFQPATKRINNSRIKTDEISRINRQKNFIIQNSAEDAEFSEITRQSRLIRSKDSEVPRVTKQPSLTRVDIYA